MENIKEEEDLESIEKEELYSLLENANYELNRITTSWFVPYQKKIDQLQRIIKQQQNEIKELKKEIEKKEYTIY